MKEKKDNFWWWIIIAILVLIPSWFYSFYTLKNSAKYTIGYTLESVGRKGHKKEVSYYYYVDDKKFEGTYTESSMFHQNQKVIVPNGQYLVVYSSKNPEIKSFLPNKPIIGEIDVDSLSRVPVAKEDIDWKRL